jgi:hypothetical protein
MLKRTYFASYEIGYKGVDSYHYVGHQVVTTNSLFPMDIHAITDMIYEHAVKDSGIPKDKVILSAFNRVK